MGLGRFLITVGVLLIVAGLVVTYGGRVPIRLGRLPGDIAIHGKNSSFYFPVTTCILLSVVLSLAMWMMRR
jgi:ribose/xylose/arabinose/galactoside ABC-type transport system permease subunit